MATVVAAPPALTGDLVLYHTTDPFFSNAPVLLFYGPAATVGAASARIQFHAFTIAGHASYPRLAVSPNSPYYSAVTNLPRDEQGDEICRGIAFGLRKYFGELSSEIKTAISTHVKAASAQKLFSDDHIAILASRLTKVENKKDVTAELIRSYAEQKVSWIDLDVVLPPGAIKELPKRSDSAGSEDFSEAQMLVQQYGRYAEVVQTFGEQAFLPTSKLKRAPSKVSSIGRTVSFLRSQKQNARKEVDELLATEQSYVARLEELIRLAGVANAETGTETFAKIFPSSLNAIHEANSDFLIDLKEVVSSTIDSSREELAAMSTDQPTSQQIRQDFLADNQGIARIAKCFCEKLSTFGDCYTAYLQNHSDAITHLRNIIRAGSPAAQSFVHHTGEQKLTSLLIEPVQRLPRYALYIDSISKQLPARHPALKHLLKAKDLVTEMCASEGESATSSINDRLRSRIASWPADLKGGGRLITAADYIELAPPFDLDRNVVHRGIALLCTDRVIMVERQGHKPITARTFMTDMESSLNMHKSDPEDLIYIRDLPLATTSFTESHEGQSLCVRCGQATEAIGATMFLLLQAHYEGKVARFVEEIIKARVEDRFSETERESCTWDVRATAASADQLSLLSAIFEDSNHEYIQQRQNKASIQIIVDIDKHSRKQRAGQADVHTVVAISPLRDGTYRMSVDSVFGHGGSEQVSLNDLGLLLRRKLALLLQCQYGSDEPSSTATTLRLNREILQSLVLTFPSVEEAEQVRPQPPAKIQRNNPLRPLSPVKMLSSLLSSSIGPGSQPPSLRKEPSGSSLISTAASYNMHPPARPAQNPSRPSSQESRPVSRDQLRPKSASSMQSFNSAKDSINGLEETFSAYLLALKARKGNIVGRSLKMRMTANELAVNELYNAMLNNHQMMVTAAQAPVDILFAAFEKFLHLAWKEQKGAVLPLLVLRDVQAMADSLFPVEFDAYLRTTLQTLPAHNQKAFKGIVNLLNDLLDGTGNDADRGALTAAFSELLVTDDDPHKYIALIDRFVDGAETYFGELLSELEQGEGGPLQSSHKRSRSLNTGSLTSNTSSLRRKFGLGLSRENSKSENENKVGVWRALSKSRSRADSPADSISRATLNRAQSTESDSRSASRPVSQDGPAPRKPASNENLQVPTITPSILPGLSTIGEHPSFIPMQPPRKKRRSSLSDLKTLDTPFVTPLRPTRSPNTRKQSVDRSLPTSPVASTPSSKGGSLRVQSPTRATPRPALPPSFRRDSPSATVAFGEATSSTKASPLSTLTENVPPSATSPTKLRQLSSIPTLSPRTSPTKPQPPVTPVRSGLAERHDAGNILRKPTSPQAEKLARTPSNQRLNAPSTKKLRVQTPQKIRERLQTEQAAIVAAHSNLQDELGKISEELSLTPSRLVPSRNHTGSQQRTATDSRLAAKVLEMETTLPQQISILTEKLEAIQSDLASSLAVSENKSKKLDELYREANAENEALYARFNSELARVLKAVRGGDGFEELKRRSADQDEEIARLKRENGRMKREVLGLRAQLKE